MAKSGAADANDGSSIVAAFLPFKMYAKTNNGWFDGSVRSRTPGGRNDNGAFNCAKPQSIGVFFGASSLLKLKYNFIYCVWVKKAL